MRFRSLKRTVASVSKPRDKHTLASRIVLALFGLFFFGIGSGFLSFFCFHAWIDFEPMFFWEKGEATILESVVADSVRKADKPYRLQVQYSYRVGQKLERAKDVYRSASLFSQTYDSYQKAQDELREFEVGKSVPVYINPEDSSESCLKLRSPFYLVFSLIPLMFVVVGLGIIYAAFSPDTDSESITPGGVAPDKPFIRKEKKNTTAGAIVMVLFSLPFMVAGVYTVYSFGLAPVLLSVEARGWSEVQAKILSRKVIAIRGSDSTSYRPDIRYSYVYDNKTYTAGQYGTRPSDKYDKRSEARSIVKRFKQGQTTSVWVDPKNPHRSLIDRSPQPSLFITFFGLVFFCAGVGLCVFGVKAFQGFSVERQQVHSHGSVSPSSSLYSVRNESPHTSLDIPKKRRLTFVAFTVAAVFVNTIVAWNAFPLEWSLGYLFLLPFLIIGLFLSVGAVKAYLMILAPHCDVICDTRSVFPSSVLEGSWEIKGNRSRLAEIAITLTGTEHAEYERGTDTVVDTEVFARMIVVQSQRPGTSRGKQRFSLRLPDDLMPSFNGEHNKILWSLDVKGVMRNWPDFQDTFPLFIQPKEITRD